MSENLSDKGANVCPDCGTALTNRSQELCPKCVLSSVIKGTRLSFAPTLSEDSKVDKDGLPHPDQPRYQTGSSIARGGMGEVIEAREVPIGRRVAMKVIHEETRDNAAVRARFIEEAQITGQLEHPSIVPMHDLNIDDRGQVFYTMKRIEGRTLAYIIKKLKGGDDVTLREYPLTRLLTVFQKICDAIAFAHSRGVIHRDLNPNNIMVGDFGEVLVLDWGLAKLTNLPDTEAGFPQSLTPGDDTPNRTLEGAVLGTIGYLSPEQALGKSREVGISSDIYALGAILYEILTLKRTVEAESIKDALQKTISADIESPVARAGKNTKIPESLSAVAMHALAKNPQDRYENVEQLQAEIEAWQNGFATAAEDAGILRHVKLFVRRHEAASFAALLIVMAITAGGVLATLAWKEADQQRLVAQQARRAAEQATAIARDRAEIIQRNLYTAEMNLASEAATRLDGLDQIANLLSKWLPTENDTDLRGWEWYYLKSLLRVDPDMLLSDTPRMASVDWSGNGNTIATAGSDGIVTLWDATNRQVRLKLEGHAGYVSVVAWNADGRRVASGGRDGTIRIWDALNGNELIQIEAHDSPVFSLSWSPNGTRVASGGIDRTAKIWNTETGQEIHQYAAKEKSRSKYMGVAWNPTLDLLSISQIGVLPRLIDTRNHNEIQTLARPISNRFFWSPDGLRFALGTDREITVWDTKTGNRLQVIPNHSYIHTMAWRPQGDIIAIGGRNTAIRLWDTTTKTMIATLKGHRDLVTSVAWDASGTRLISSSNDQTVRFWNISKFLPSTPGTQHEGARVARWSPDGNQILVKSYDRYQADISILDAQTQRQIRELPSPQDAATIDCVWSPDGTRIAAIDDHSHVRIHIAKTDSIVEALNLDDSSNGSAIGIPTVTWSADGTRLAYGGRSDELKIYHPGDNKFLVSLPFKDLLAMRWNPNGTRLAAANYFGVHFHIWDTATWEKTAILKFSYHTGRTLSLCWSPDGNYLVTGTVKGKVCIWNAKDGAFAGELKGHRQQVRALAWSPVGDRLASSGAGRIIRIWDMKSHTQVMALEGHKVEVNSLEWSPDGRKLLSAGRDRIIVWDATKGYQSDSMRQPVN
ncbi:MAG: serine/threonine protein kinase [Verrucomicrobiales bacterium]|nr:serine/threonine protein kinase [Verrucomicrobiales bacterium]